MPVRRRFHRRRFHRRKPSIAPAVKRVINRMITEKAEHKYFDTNSSVTVIDTGAITSLVDIPQGTNSTQRVGQQVSLRSLRLRIDAQANGTPVATWFRVIVFRGHDENGVAFVPTDILQLVSVGSDILFQSKNRFRIFYDRVFVQAPVSNPGITRRIMVHFKGQKVNYSGNTTTKIDGGLYLLMLSTEHVNGPAVTTTARVTFVDE